MDGYHTPGNNFYNICNIIVRGREETRAISSKESILAQHKHRWSQCLVGLIASQSNTLTLLGEIKLRMAYGYLSLHIKLN